MRAFLLSAYEEPSPGFVKEWLIDHGSPGEHELVDAPEAADVIIFAETFASLDPCFIDVLLHPVFKHFRHKCVLHHHSDCVVTFCPTVSPSVETWQPNQSCRRSFHYIARRREIQMPLDDQIMVKPRYLFSFQGDATTHTVRTHLMGLRHSDAFLADCSGALGDKMTKSDRDAFHLEYCRKIAESHFVLCPRGLGPTSMRLFEVMQLGRVPVIISDDWKLIDDVPWETFSIFIREADVTCIPAVLEQRRFEAEAMGRRARSAWERYFSPRRSLVRLIEEAAATLITPHGTLRLLRDLTQLTQTRYWRGFGGALTRRVRFAKANTFPA